MAVSSRGRSLEVEPINLTPLLDCILNLIFFFLLATTIKETKQAIEVQIPQAEVGAQKPEGQKEIVITIGSGGQLFLNDDAVTSGQLRTRLSEMGKEPSPEVPVRIRGDREAHLQAFVDVVSVCLESGHPNYILDIKKTKQGP
jgi:biopolymer transport protein ExbD